MKNKMSVLHPQSSAACILLRNHTGKGYVAGVEFPGDTIRKAIDKLFALGFLADINNRMIVTRAGQAYLSAHHLDITA